VVLGVIETGNLLYLVVAGHSEEHHQRVAKAQYHIYWSKTYIDV
jgi:hypothetical protein